MLRRLVLLCALLLAPLMAGPLLAHQQKITITTVAVNPRTGMIEVVHQVPVHDAERCAVVAKKHAVRAGEESNRLQAVCHSGGESRCGPRLCADTGYVHHWLP